MVTNPFDVVKTRLQLQNLKAARGEAAPIGLVRTGINLVRHEGAAGLWSGLTPALARGFLYGGLRLGLYTPIKEGIAGMGSGGAISSAGGTPPISFTDKLLAGSLSGGIASLITNPTELIKTRLQDKRNTHKGSVGVIRHVVSTEGLAGLWRGAIPGMTRASMVTACQCGTYDEFKRIVLERSGWGECMSTHLVASLLAGLVATTVTNPIDVIKTVVFTGGKNSGGPLGAARDILANDGAKGFFKGWVANFARLGPQTVVTFIVNEELRNWLNMPHF